MAYQIMIPLHKSGGKLRDNRELLYALRSYERHFKGPYEVTIIGPKLPDWLHGAKHIPTNKGLKTALVLAADAQPNGFFWCYDDQILLRDTTPEEMMVPFANSHWSKAQTGWARSLEKVRQRLVDEGCANPRDYSRPHGPSWLDKGMVDESFRDWPGMAGRFPFETWIHNKRGTPHRTKGIRQYYGGFRSPPEDRFWFMNFNEAGFTPELMAWLDKRFPEPSKWEKVESSKPAVEIPPPASRNAIAFSLFGPEAKYSAGLCQNIEAAKQHYPGWEVIAHVEEGHYAIERLRGLGAVVIERKPEPERAGTFWRFAVGSMDGRYDRVIFRDADSRVNAKERAAVDEWIASNKILHIMRDHADHKVPVCAGMFGIKTGSFDFLSEMDEWPRSGHFRDDEKFLAFRMWPKLKNDAVIHTGDNFPAHEPINGHIGQVVAPGFDPAKTKMVLISPEKYSRRRARFMESLEKHGGFLNDLELEWFKATPHEETLFPPTFQKFAKRAHWWAATCDHARVMERALVGGWEDILIFEDDVIFRPDFNEMFWRAWAALPGGWKGMRMGWNARFDQKGTGNPVIHEGVLSRCNKDGQGMYSMLWNQKGLMRFYDHFWHRRNMTVDEAFEDLRRREPKDWYQTWQQVAGVDPNAKQMGGDS